MILKEAFRYQKFLNELISEAETYLRRDNFITKSTETHNRNKANPDAENEVINVQKPYTVDFTPMDLINFLVKAISEKQALSDAISQAKSGTEIDIDSAIAMNKIKQAYVFVLQQMANTKSVESKNVGTDYKFDITGEQKKYIYDIDCVKTIDFDRNDVKALIKKYSKETEEISAKLDMIYLTVEVNFEPSYDINDLEDIVLS